MTRKIADQLLIVMIQTGGALVPITASELRKPEGLGLRLNSHCCSFSDGFGWGICDGQTTESNITKN